MKIKFQSLLLLLPLFFLLACTDDPISLDEPEDGVNTELVELSSNGELQGDGGGGDSAGGDYDPVCVTFCNLDAKDCYEWALHLKNLHLESCDYIRRIGVEVIDVYCTRTVIVGYEEVEVFSPEGELIRVDQVPIYLEEQYVCGQEEEIIYSNDPALLQEVQECEQQAAVEYVEAIDKCDLKKSSCLKKCKKGPLGEL